MREVGGEYGRSDGDRGGRAHLFWEFCAFCAKSFRTGNERKGSLTIESEGFGHAADRYRPGLPDFTRQEKWLCGNKRTLKWQYAARNWASVRILPGIVGYCRIVGPCEFGMRRAECGVRVVGKICRAYRFGPAGTAWYRLGPDKFFSRREIAGEKVIAGLWWDLAATQSVGVLPDWHQAALCRLMPLGQMRSSECGIGES